MIDAAKRGVEVRLLVDGWGSKFKELKKEFDAAGVKAKKYRPLRLFSIYKVGRRTHRKILVVDGRIGYTGGLGIDERWLGDARNTNEWRDTQVRAEGPVAGADAGHLQRGLDVHDRRDPRRREVLSARSARRRHHRQAIKASRGDSTSLAKMLYFVAIESAAKHLHPERLLPAGQAGPRGAARARANAASTSR